MDAGAWIPNPASLLLRSRLGRSGLTARHPGQGLPPTPHRLEVTYPRCNYLLRRSSAKRPEVADGIVITPSHNPPSDGGFKYNPPNGGPADTSATRWIQDR